MQNQPYHPQEGSMCFLVQQHPGWLGLKKLHMMILWPKGWAWKQQGKWICGRIDETVVGCHDLFHGKYWELIKKKKKKCIFYSFESKIVFKEFFTHHIWHRLTAHSAGLTRQKNCFPHPCILTKLFRQKQQYAFFTCFNNYIRVLWLPRYWIYVVFAI